MLPPMSNLVVATIATLLGGALIALQAPLNSELGGSVGTFAAASVNFLVGAALLVAWTMVFAGGFGDLSEARSLPWYYVLGGGIIGAAFVTIALLAVRTLGAAGVTAATLAGRSPRRWRSIAPACSAWRSGRSPSPRSWGSPSSRPGRT